MEGNLSDFQAANVNCLKLLAQVVKNTEPQNRGPEMKIQNDIVFYSKLKFTVCFNFETLKMNFRRYLGHIIKLTKD